MKNSGPTGAILAITFRCNSRCLICDIWQRKQKGDVGLDICQKLPGSLRSIDITGGEPFLHPNLVGLVKTLKKTCPKARLLITTNGLLSEKIKKITPQLLQIDKNLAIRVSLDGMEEIHGKMRGVKGAFKKAIKSLKVLKQSGVKDLGIIFTLTKINKNEIKKILNFCKEEKLNFSLNLVYDSPIYFGLKHKKLSLSSKEIQKSLDLVISYYQKSLLPKNFGKRWFYQELKRYLQTQKRSIPCGAGEGFFYLDPQGNVYPCHLKNWLIGDLNKQSFGAIWRSHKKKEYLSKTEQCSDCFLICTTKEQIKKNKMKVISQLFCSGK